MVSVIPAIIPEDLQEIEEKVARVYRLVNRVQVDLIDGVYVPNSLTWPFANKSQEVELERLASEENGLPYWKDIDYEIDMMVSEPERFLERLVGAGVTAIIIHYKSTTEHLEILKDLKESDVGVGIAFTPNDFVSPDKEALILLAEKFDFVQVMGSDVIGHSGVDLDERVFVVVKDLRERFPQKEIAVDIGVDEETASSLVEAGVTKLVSGSAIFEAEDPESVIKILSSF